jgi:UDP-N-acetylglucosamine--N-acetylmuramyl-(pentapeptide) pyrophosphoryl-undecaprenol N-acetylglucosamine transferase
MGRTNPWLVLAGGGTGGHLYPGLAVAEAMRHTSPGLRVTLFGTLRPIDQQVADAWKCELVRQPIQPFPRQPWRWPAFLKNWRQSLRMAKERFAESPPSFVLGLGGFGAVPSLMAAHKAGVPTALFNPDAQPGRANRFLTRYVDEVFVQWPVTARQFIGIRATVRITGCPVRRRIVEASREEGVSAFGLDSDKFTLLITGASQGAHSINQTCVRLARFFSETKEWQLLHLTGPTDLEDVRSAYKAHRVSAHVAAYTEQMPDALAAADLVISRAGASTLGELTVRGLPSILLPYPYDRRRHQSANAQVLSHEHAALIVEDQCNPERNAGPLREALYDVMRSEERRRRMGQAALALGRTDAAERIAERLLDLAGLTD